MAGEAIFIGYRRDDTADVAGRIYDALAQRFGKARIFKDVDNIPLGADFGDHIKAVLSRCRVALILIGPGWIEARNAAGARRIDDALDWVRVEVETALAIPGLLVVPVLINGAHMPAAEAMPATLTPLLRRNAAIIRRDPDFHGDAARLAKAMSASVKTGILDLSAINESGSRRRGVLLAGALATVALASAALFGFWEMRRDRGDAPPEPGSQSVATQAELRRGWHVYREACASCHALGGLSFADLGVRGGPLWDERFPEPGGNNHVIEAARGFTVVSRDTEGQVFERRATPADRIPAPYANAALAMQANGGAFPTDLLTLTARGDGPFSVEDFLRGYQDAPAGVSVPSGAYFNRAASGAGLWADGQESHPNLTRMPPPLTNGRVVYDDGETATVDQMIDDVGAFLSWAKSLPLAAPAVTQLRYIASDTEDDFEVLLRGDASMTAALARRGERVSSQCRACHTFEAGGPNTIGPNLHDAYGDSVGARGGFSYSAALAQLGGRWSGTRLDAYLAAPVDAAPGTSMNYAGVHSEIDRVAIIAYMRGLSRQAP